MLDLEACAIAGKMLVQCGFEHRYTSMKSEASYYGWPGKAPVIRVACHKAHRHELHGVPVIATITFNTKNFKQQKTGIVQIPKNHVVRTVAEGIGKYFLSSSGALRARARYREYWDDGEVELPELEHLQE